MAEKTVYETHPRLHTSIHHVLAVLGALAICCTHTTYAQSPGERDLDSYYRFPLSVGFEYQSLTPFGDYGADFNVYELRATVLWPISSLPFLQPAFSFGATQFDSTGASDLAIWGHTDWFAEVGLRFATRISKQFEVGAELLGGYSVVIFPDLLPEVGPIGASALVLEAGGILSLDPSFNLSITVHPSLRYIGYLNPLTDYNGLIFGIGFQASYRFGQDPDAPQAVIRSIRFDRVTIPSLFSAMQSYYVKHPIGSITFTNIEQTAIRDISVSFNQKGYMDSPTQSAKVDELAPGARMTVDLFASFNAQVFTTEGVTPMTGEVIVTYSSGGRPGEQSQSVSYDLYDKTALTWNDDQKVGAFITPADGALRNYASFIRQASKEVVVPGLSTALQYAMQLHAALGEIGMLYQSDPASPFTVAQGNGEVVDSVSIPRDTLKRSTGDCDDLTVLYASMLEAAGVASGFITVPGHIYAAFDTGVASRDYAQLHPDRSMSLSIDGELWVPVEITLIGTAGFMDAWRKGIEEYVAWEKQPGKRRLYKTAAAQTLYRPIGLKETDLGLQYGSGEKIAAGFRSEVEKLVGLIAERYAEAAREHHDKADYNRLGVVYAKFNQLAKARAAFEQALATDPGYLPARMNLANVLFLDRRYPEALTAYLDAETALVRAGLDASLPAANLFVNVAKTCSLLGQNERAQSYYEKAKAIDPSEATNDGYLSGAATGGGGARSAEAVDAPMDIRYFDESAGGGL